MAEATRALDTATAPGAVTGERFVERLRDGREVWLNGARVDVTAHPAFAGVLGELRRLYDLQHSDEHRDAMTFASPESGRRLSVSYLLPRAEADLIARRTNASVWADQTWGLLGAMPDLGASVLVGLYDLREDLARVDARFGANVANYYRFASEHDLFLCQAADDPQIDRSDAPGAAFAGALRIVRETDDGIVVRGAKQLSVNAPLANEMLVFISSASAKRTDPSLVQWFAIPIATEGLRLLCREPLSPHAPGYRHDFAATYDEIEATVFFDDVSVPWGRVFLAHDADVAWNSLPRLGAWARYSSAIRFWHKIQTFIGVTTMIAEAIGIDGYRGMRDRMGEMTSYGEMLRAILRGTERKHFLTPGGLCSPDQSLAPSLFAVQVEGRLVEILRELAASGMLMQPSEADLASPELRPLLDTYMRGKTMPVTEKARLFRLAWDLVGDGVGARADLFERWHRGDLVGNRNLLFATYDRTRLNERIQQLIADPLPLPNITVTGDGALTNVPPG